MSESTKLRDRASLLAHSDPKGAEGIADRIEEPWFRAQALAWVARYAGGKDVERLAAKAFDAASQCADPYEQAASCAWVVRALIERGRHEVAMQFVEAALQAVGRAEKASSRSEALFLLFQACFDAAPEVRRSMLMALADLYDKDPHWRVERNFRDALAMARDVDNELVTKLARGRDEKATLKLQKALAGAVQEPRAFFW